MGLTRKNLSFRKILTIYSVSIILMMLILNFTSIRGISNFFSKFNKHLQELSLTHSIASDVDELYAHIENYILSSEEDYITKYEVKLKSLMNRLDAYMKNSSNENVYYQYYDLIHMMETFSEKSDTIIMRHRIQMERIYIDNHLAELKRLKGYIHEELQSTISIKLNDVRLIYSDLKNVIKNKVGETYIYALIIGLVCLVFAYIFSQQMSKPIHQLVIQLKKVAKGNYDTDEVKTKGKGELKTLVEVFNYMMVQLRKQIEIIHEKSVIQKKLQQEEIKNLEMANSLKQSQLNYLQSQINPHFLFNTLNSISTLADIEDANQTKKMLESLSELLRHNLQKINDIVTLEDEFEIIKNYIYIQMVRFGNRIEYILEMDDGVKDYRVPSMILQPFIENAIIHGLEPKEGKGHLMLKISSNNDDITIVIEDDGIGMPEEKVNALLQYDHTILLKRNYTSGMGVSNVIKRLSLYFNEDVVSLTSEEGKGTKIVITMPQDFIRDTT